MFEHDAERFTLVAVVAMARNRVIGLDNAMPWRLRADLKRYRRLTMGRPMVMGRKTLDSIGRVLDGRDTIVLTHSDAVPFEEALVAAGPQDALRLAAERARSRGADEIVIAGGAQIYETFLPWTDRVEMTLVDAEPEGDTRFPPLPEADWRQEPGEAMEASPGDTARARFLTLSRRRGD